MTYTDEITRLRAEVERLLTGQHDIYAAAREEYRKRIAEQAADNERLRAALENPVSDDEHIWIYERAAARFRDWSRAGVRGQKIYPQDGIEYWTALATRECLIARAALATQPQQKERT